MCIIVQKPAGVVLPRRIWENCWSRHSDGAGFLVAKDGALIMEKGFFSLDELLKAFAPYENENAVVHFRFGTMGGRNADNCHPFLIHEDLGFVHNGTIHKIDRKEFRYSDTWHFNELVMKPLVQTYPGIWAHKTVKFLIEEYIGSGNKLVFMNNEGVVRIYNEDKGIRDHGCWFSNCDFRTFHQGSRGGRTHQPSFCGTTSTSLASASGNTSTQHATGSGFDLGSSVACDNCNRLVDKEKAQAVADYTVCSDCWRDDPTVKNFATEFAA